MDVVLHCGAHRTNSSGLQGYVSRHGDALLRQHIDTCTLKGPLARGVPGEKAHKAQMLQRDAIAHKVQQAEKRGVHRLFLSDVNILGCLSDVVHKGLLYPDAGARLSHFAELFEGRLSEVVLSTRSPETYWISALSAAVAHGAAVPDRAALRAIAFNRRAWRDVITDMAKALPDVRLRVIPFEHYSGRPEQILVRSLGCDLPFEPIQPRQNRAPQLPELRRLLAERGGSASDLPFGMGPWNPFCAEELAAMRELYADDLMWLVGGADGLATMTEEPSGKRAVCRPPAGYQVKGQCNGKEERHMARPGRG
ncbi:MAG: hypothetical protein AB8B58_15780 [Roseobacter sp.]